MTRGSKNITCVYVVLSILWVIIPVSSTMNLAITQTKNVKTCKSTYSPTFSDGIIQISENTGSDYNPFIFRDILGRFWILWANGSGSNGAIWATNYNETSKTIGTPFRITDNPSDDWNPTGFLDHRGVLWIFWQSNRAGNYDIWYKNSSNNGGLWSTAYQLTNSISNEGTPYCAIDSNNDLWVFFETSNGGSKDLVYKTSTNNGSTWTITQSIDISNGLVHEEIQDLFIRENNEICLLVQELVGSFASYVWRTSDSGSTWTKHKISNHDNTGWEQIFGDEKNTCVIIWRNSEFYFLNSTDLITGWSREKPLTSENTHIQHPNAGIFTNSSLYIVFVSNQTGNLEVYLEIRTPDIPLVSSTDPDLLGIFIPSLLAVMALFSIYQTMKFLWNRKDDGEEVETDMSFSYTLSSVFYLVFGNIAIRPTLRRLSIDEVEMNDLRQEILDLLYQNEFLHFRELKRITNRGTSHLRWHLRILTEFGYVGHSHKGQYLVYFLTTKRPDEEYLHLYFNLLSIPSLVIASAFSKIDTWQIQELMNHVKLPEKTVRYHCRKLQKKNIIEKEGKSLFKLNGHYEGILKVVINHMENS